VSIAAQPANARVGRFQIIRLLGQGAQAAVWLAHDPRLDRSVALKMFELPNGVDGEAPWADLWLEEARAVSRLSHPNVVPVFEAELHDGRPVLVFEYVQGKALAEARSGQGPLPERQAVEMMLGVVDALTCAHALGIVHRDLKPANLMLGADGRLRVMDFGIATRAVGQPPAFLAGTPGYMAPEALTGAPPQPSMDLYALGVILAELLSGQRLARGGSAPELGHIDDALRAHVLRAMAIAPEQRFAGAAAFRDALQAWLEPPAASSDAEGSATLQFLLRRMRHKSDFPALSAAVGRIQQLSQSENETLQGLAQAVMQDVALTHKLLRLVNTVHYQRADGGIQSVARAVALVGFAGVRNLALSLVLLEHMRNKTHAGDLVHEFARALMAATLASELAAGSRQREEVFIGAMFQNLGRLLVQFYLPEEAQMVQQRRASQGLSDAQAAVAVLGVDLETLGCGVARSWGLPETLLRCMRTPVGEPPSKRLHDDERPRWLARAANDLTDVLLTAMPAELPRALAGLAERHARALGLEPRHMMEATRAARLSMLELSKALGLQLAEGSAAHRLLPAQATTRVSTVPAQTAPMPFAATVIQTVPLAAPTRPSGALASAQHDALSKGIEELTAMLLADDVTRDAVFARALEILQSSLGLRRALLCLRAPDGASLQGQMGVGVGATLCRQFTVPLVAQAQPELFTALCQRGADSAIENAHSGAVAARLPAWFHTHFNADSFFVMPLMVRGAPLGMLYGEPLAGETVCPDEKTWGLLRTFRNQVLMALKQAA
jgi:eukaryotic-like serine/threonine-protein kinase